MTTYTLEPYNFDGYLGFGLNMTQAQLGGPDNELAPFVKIPYVADAMPWNDQTGADRIHKLMTNGTIQPGDTVMGFSLGAQVVALYLSQHKPSAGVKFLLVGMTYVRNEELLTTGNAALFGTGGIPWDIPNPVHFIANQYDGYSDFPDKKTAQGYNMAVQNKNDGMQRVHNYVNARLGHSANVAYEREGTSITAELVPTIWLPMNMGLREWGFVTQANAQDAEKRAKIDEAYSRPSPNATQLAAAVSEQVGLPAAQWVNKPEPVASV